MPERTGLSAVLAVQALFTVCKLLTILCICQVLYNIYHQLAQGYIQEGAPGEPRMHFKNTSVVHMLVASYISQLQIASG